MAKLIGTDPNQVPTNADLGTMAYQDHRPAYFSVSRNAGALTGGVAGDEILGWNVVNYDNLGGFDASTGKYTVQESGLYLFSFSATFSTSSLSGRYFRVRLKRTRNGSTVTLCNPHQTISDETGDADYNNLSATVVELSQKGDVFYITYGSSLDIGGSDTVAFYEDMGWFNGAKLAQPTEETIENPLITTDVAERAAAQATVDATPAAVVAAA